MTGLATAHRARSYPWLVIGIILCIDIIVCVGLGLLWGATSSELKQLLPRWTVLSLTGCSLSIVAGVLLLLPHVGRQITGPRIIGVVALALIVVGGMILVTCAPKVSLIFFDEQIYQGIAQAIALTGAAHMVTEGDAASPGTLVIHQFEYNKQPNGYPFYLSLLYRLWGSTDGVAYAANVLSYGLGVFAVCLVGWFLFRSWAAGLASAMLYALTPMTVIWSHTASAESSAATTGVLAVLGTLAFKRAPRFATALLCAGLLSFALYIRPESLLILIPVGLLVLSDGGRFIERPIFWITLLITIVLSAGEFAHLWAVQDEGWGTHEDKFGWHSIWPNLLVNGPFYFVNAEFPLLWSVLAIIGALWPGNRLERTMLVLWFVSFAGIYLLFYAGSYHYGADVRFSLLTTAPLAILGGRGCDCLFRLTARKFSLPLTAILFVVTVVWSWLSFIPLIARPDNQAILARLDVHYVPLLAQSVPDDGLVLTHNPSVWLLQQKNAAQMSFAAFDPKRLLDEYFKRYPGGVYLHWNYWCNVPYPLQNTYCERVKKDYQLVPVAEYRDRDFIYAIYRLIDPRSDTGKGE